MTDQPQTPDDVRVATLKEMLADTQAERLAALKRADQAEAERDRLREDLAAAQSGVRYYRDARDSVSTEAYTALGAAHHHQQRARDAELRAVRAEAALDRVRALAKRARGLTAVGADDWQIGQQELAQAVLDALDGGTEAAPAPAATEQADVTAHQPAYDAVYTYIRSLGDELPPSPVHRNAMIWRAVNAALNAAPAATEATERCVHCRHSERDHDGRADHRVLYSPLVAGDPWCHACNAPCDYATPAAAEATEEQQ